MRLTKKKNRDCEVNCESDSNSSGRVFDEFRMAGLTTNPSGDGDDKFKCHTPVPTVPPSPHLSINRSAYNLADFNKKFEALESNRNAAEWVWWKSPFLRVRDVLGQW